MDLRNDSRTLKWMQERNERPVTAEEGQKLAEEIGAFKYVECSALTGRGLNAVFEECIRSCLNKNAFGKSKKGEKKWRREKCIVL